MSTTRWKRDIEDSFHYVFEECNGDADEWITVICVILVNNAQALVMVVGIEIILQYIRRLIVE
jgi:hypothetical protein